MNPADREPPCNLEAETKLLGCCLLDPRAIDDTTLIVTRDDFHRAAHAEAWDVIHALRETGTEVDATTFANYLEERGKFTLWGGNDYLSDICLSVPHAANAAYYAGIVREKAVARRVLEACEETMRACYSRQLTSAELLASLEERVFAIGEGDATNNTAELSSIVVGAMDTIGERADGVAPGVMTGFPDLDHVTSGLRPGTLAVLAARPGIGKTAMGMCIAANVAANLKQPALFVSLEMDRGEIGERYLSASAEISSTALKRPAEYLDERGWERLTAAAGRLRQLPVFVDDSAVRTVPQIAANARRIKRRHGLAIVVVDYLGLIDGQRERGDNRQEEVAKISRRLRHMAKDLRVPVLALHQLNREAEKRDDRRPRMADLRESGAIEQDAHYVFLLHRPEAYDPADKPGMAEVIVAKNRSGPTMRVELAFRKEWTRFESRPEPAELGNDAAF